MRMATRRRRWCVTGGATAAVAIGVWAAVALATPGGVTATTPTNAPVVSWTESAGPATGYDLQRADGACPGASFSNVGSTGPGVLSRADTPPNDGTFCYRVVGHYGDPDAPETSADTAQVVFDATPPAVPMFSSPAAGATLHSPITVTANSSDSSGVALKSLTISVVGGATLATAANAQQRDRSVGTWGRQLHAQSSCGRPGEQHVRGDDPGHRGQHAPTGVPGLRTCVRAGRADAVLVVAGWPVHVHHHA